MCPKYVQDVSKLCPINISGSHCHWRSRYFSTKCVQVFVQNVSIFWSHCDQMCPKIWTLFGHIGGDFGASRTVQNMSKKYPKIFYCLDTIWTPNTYLDTILTSLGHLLDMIWTYCRHGHILDIFWTHYGHMLDSFWTLSKFCVQNVCIPLSFRSTIPSSGQIVIGLCNLATR